MEMSKNYNLLFRQIAEVRKFLHNLMIATYMLIINLAVVIVNLKFVVAKSNLICLFGQ
jgi:hypothetical protein